MTPPPDPLFLSTPSARRATHYRYIDRTKMLDISIHALREEGDDALARLDKHLNNFYPRPPRGGRRRPTDLSVPVGIFLSTPSARRATCGGVRYLGACTFLSTPSARRATPKSIPCSSLAYYFYPRPPRGGRPSPSGSHVPPGTYFYPRPPRGGRRRSSTTEKRLRNFYPRPPRGGRRLRWRLNEIYRAISIHALREEGDGPLLNE